MHENASYYAFYRYIRLAYLEPMVPGEPAFLLVVLAAFATGALSAMVGMAGGITLLSIMLLVLDPLEAIPLHGAVQLVSNGSRTLLQRRHVQVRLLLPYCALLLPMGYLGLGVAHELPPTALKAAIGVFILIATWRPGWLRLPDRRTGSERTHFLLLGAATGFLQTTVGAVGPLLAPFFLRLNLSRFGLIGTKAACQSAGHLTKLVLFGAIGFPFASHGALLGTMACSVALGTLAGTHLLARTDDRTFVHLYRLVLSCTALRLVLSPAL